MMMFYSPPPSAMGKFRLRAAICDLNFIIRNGLGCIISGRDHHIGENAFFSMGW
ncbi:hypothetical protein HC231_02040 [Brenneria izadpanahii]|uniref:Uncharacterized protein n=1 Tax=Brenneria izadpanahii TaxID=2722756 RepID=A0ABX7UQL6_9GAMM|nr:hypothetical protein [Brenneria izadpanahii]QTF06852.1 hypothetical protein HC231_02040 [Brenneria izadpanahii]